MTGQSYVASSTGILKKVLVSRPDYLALAPINKIASDWIHKGVTIDKMKALKEHDEFIQIYKNNDIEVEIVPPQEQLTSMVFARDFGFMLKEGYVLGRFKESVRQKETKLYAQKLKALNIPLIGECTEGYIEGGDFWQLEEKLIAIGRLQRSNMKGINQLRRQLKPYGYEIIDVVADPKYLHLDMVFNIVGDHTAVAYLEALPKAFITYLKKNDYDIISIDEEGVFKHFANVQALGNKKVISLKQNNKVNKALAKRDYEVFELDADEILKTGGGPHCMTFPLKRS